MRAGLLRPISELTLESSPVTLVEKAIPISCEGIAVEHKERDQHLTNVLRYAVFKMTQDASQPGVHRIKS